MLDHPIFQRYSTPQHEELKQAAQSYFEQAPVQDWLREPGSFLKKSQWREFGKLGFLGASLPEKHGGRGLGVLGALILGEAMSRLGDSGFTLGMHCQNEISAHWLATAQEEELRNKYLPEMIAGRLVGCACDTEPNGGMDATAVRDGDGYVVNARKLYVVNGYHADLCFVTLKLDGEPTTMVVEKDRPGVRVLKVFDKLGTRAVDSAMVEFEDVRVPAINLSLKRGMRQSMHWNKIMATDRYLICADAYYLHGILLDKILQYGKGRKVGDKLLTQWPINRHALARAAADHKLMGAGLVDIFPKLMKKRNVVTEVAALKWFCVERATEFAALCAEMQGGAGYMHDSEFLRIMAQLRGLKMAGGSSTTMKAIANQGFAYQEELDAIA